MALLQGEDRYVPLQALEAEKKRRRREAKLRRKEAAARPKDTGYVYPAKPEPTMPGALGEFEAAGIPTAGPPQLDPKQMLRDIDRAYFELHGTHPSSGLAAMLLVSLPMARSVEDYRALLEPGTYETSGDPRQIGKTLAAPTAPGGKMEMTAILQKRRMPYRMFSIDGDEQNLEKWHPLVAGERDKPLRVPFTDWEAGFDPTGEVNPWQAKNTIEVMKLYAGESRDKDRTAYERAEHDLMLRDITQFMEVYGERLVTDGAEAIDFDPESGVITKKTIAAYANYVIDRVKADYFLGTPQQQVKAMEAIEVVAEAAFGDKAKEVVASFKYMQQAFQESDVPNEQLLNDLYRSFVRGRGLNQNEKQGMWDFIQRYERQYLPPEAAAAATEDSISFMDILDDTMGTAIRAFGGAVEKTTQAVGTINPVNAFLGIAGYAPGKAGLWADTLNRWHDDLFDKALAPAAGWVASMEPLMYGISYVERAGVTMANVLDAAGIFGPVELMETLTGQEIPLLPEGGRLEGTTFTQRMKHIADTFTSVAEWRKAWDESNGRMVVERMADSVCEDLGLPRDNPAIGAVVAGLDLYVACKIGSKADVMVRTGARKMPKVGLRLGRAGVDAARLAYSSGVKYYEAMRQVYGVNNFAFDLNSPRARRAMERMTPEERSDFQRKVEEMNDIEAEYADVLEADATAPIEDIGGVKPVTDLDLFNLLKKIGIERSNDFYPDVTGRERLSVFKGTERPPNSRKGPGRPVDELAQEISSKYPEYGITDGESLVQWIANFDPKAQESTVPRVRRTEANKNLDRAADLYDEVQGAIEKTETTEAPAAAETPAAQRLEDFIDEAYEGTVGMGPSGGRGVFFGEDLAIFDLVAEGDFVRVNTIRAEKAGTGVGSRALKRITALADKRNVRLKLTSEPYGENAMPRAVLDAWYEKHGFVKVGETRGMSEYVYEPRAAETGMAAPERMFAGEEYIAEGQQAGLELGIDREAGFTEPFAGPPEKGPAQMPGQTAMGAAPRTINRAVERAVYVEPWTGSGPPSYIIVASRMMNAKTIDPKTGERLARPRELTAEERTDLRVLKTVEEPTWRMTGQTATGSAREIYAQPTKDIRGDLGTEGGWKKSGDGEYRNGDMVIVKAEGKWWLGWRDKDGLLDIERPNQPYKSLRDAKRAHAEDVLPNKDPYWRSMEDKHTYTEAELAAAKRGEPVTGEPQRVGPVETDSAGNQVREVEGVGKVDASMAEAVAAVNDGFAKTKGSHSAFPLEHAKGSKAIKEGAPAYIEWNRSELTKKKGALAKVRELDGHNGLKVVEENGLVRIEGKTSGDMAYVADVLTGKREPGEAAPPPMTEAQYADQYAAEGYTGPERRTSTEPYTGPERRGAAPPPEGPPVAEGAAPLQPARPYKRYPKILQTVAEAVAEYMPETINGIGTQSAIRRVLGIPDLPHLRPALTELGKAKTPQEVIAIMEKYDLEFDPMMPGVFRTVRFDHLVSGNRSAVMTKLRIFGTYVALTDKMPLTDSDFHVYHLARAFKMGRKKWDAVAQERANWWAQKFWEAGDDVRAKQELLGKLDKDGSPTKGSFYHEIYTNIGPTEWARFIKFRERLLRMRGRRWLGMGHKRGYGLDDKTVPVTYRRRLAAEVKEVKEKIRQETDEATAKQLEADLSFAQRKVRMYDEAARVLQTGKPKKNMSLEDARMYMEELANPEPLATWQLLKHVQQPVDPRLLTWFLLGDKSRKALRMAMYAENIPIIGLAPLTRAFKLVALATMGFPLRVLAGDEFTRLVPEGIGLGYGTSLLGTKRYREAKGTVKAMRSDGKFIEISEDLYEKLHYDWLTEYSDDFRVVSPQELSTIRGGWKAMSNFLSKTVEEPLLQEWLKMGDERPTSAQGIRDFVIEQLSRQDEVGETLRSLLVDTQRITTKQTNLTVLRRLFAHPETVTGAAGNLNRFLTAWVDMLGKVGHNERLLKMFLDRDFSQKTLERITSADPNALPAIPLKESFSSRYGGYANPANWLQKWYEGIPTGPVKKIPGIGRVMPDEIGVMPLLAKLTNQMRETFFGDAYNKEMAKLRAKDPEYKNMTPEQMHEQALNVAMHYVNRVTYVRNATVFEDMIRNVVPFVNSYRQFALYWGQAFAKHPFAMSAYYKYAPQRGVMSQQVGDMQYFIPPIPFWMPQTTEDDTPLGFARNVGPNVNTFIAMTIGALLRGPGGIQSDLEQVPGLGATGRGWAPFGRASRLLASFGIFLGPFGVDENKVLREHRAILQAITDVDDKPLGVDAAFEPDYAFPMDLMYKIGMPMPEQAMQWLFSTFTPLSQKYNPREKVLVDTLKRNMIGMTPLQLSQWVDENPKADQLLQVWQEKNMKRRNELIAKWPWTEKYTVSNYDYSEADGRWIPTTADFISKVNEGLITVITDDRQWLRNLSERHVSIFGGYTVNKNTGNLEYIAPVAEAAKAKTVFEAQMKKAKAWAKRTANTLAGGDKELAAQLYKDWETGVDDGDEGLRMPSLFEEAARRDGLNPADYNPISLAEAYETDYGANDRIQNNEMSDTTKAAVADLINKGLMGPDFKLNFESISPFAPDIRKKREELVLNARKAVLDPADEEFYNLDGLQVCRMVGLPKKLAPGLDAAILDVRKYYYNVYQPVKDQYGAQSSEARAAKLEFDKYRDKRFSQERGGKYLVGGLPERVLNIRYFNRPRLATLGQGRNASKQENLWNDFWSEAMSENPDPDKLTEYYAHFGKANVENWEEVVRVSHHVYVAGMARYYRQIMKESYSEYYKGPGNSVFTNYGKQMVANVRQLIKEAISLDGGRKTSAFYNDITNYFESPETYARNLLEWAWH